MTRRGEDEKRKDSSGVIFAVKSCAAFCDVMGVLWCIGPCSVMMEFKEPLCD